VLLICAIFVAWPMSLSAQTTSIIEGTVLDTQKRAIVGAQITLSGPVLAREVKTRAT